MTFALTQTATAVGPGMTASFLGVDGTEPYTYAVQAGGAGGTIDAETGIYTAPSVINPSVPADVILVTDSTSAVATAQIVVGSPLFLLCDIIQKEMGLANGRVYLWDQKIMQPSDSGLYVAVSEISPKPFANVNRSDGSGDGVNEDQFVVVLSQIDVDIISRGSEARDRKLEVLLALNSVYSRQQQDANSFWIGQLSNQFLNLSQIDGAAIPYRYKISFKIQYAYTKTAPVDYFDTFTDTITTDA